MIAFVLGTLALLLGLAAAGEGAASPPEAALASELLALEPGEEREAWVEAHSAQVTAELGRQVAAQALVLQRAAQYEPALAAFALAVRLGERSGDARSRILGLHGQGEVERERGRPQEALELLERGLAEAGLAGERASAARLSGSLGLARLQLGQYDEALQTFERQLAAFESLGDTKGVGQALSNLGIALGTLGRFGEAAQAFERSRASMEAAGYAPGVPRALNNLGRTYRELGNYAAALRALSQSLALKEAAGNRAELATTLKNIGEVYLLQGALQQGLDHFERSYAIAAELGQKTEMATALEDQGAALVELGRLEEARGALERALALAEEISAPEAILSITAELADALHRLGLRDQALALLERSLADGERSEDLPPLVPTRRQIAMLRLEAGDAAAALALSERAAEAARRFELRDELWRALLVAGQALLALGQPEGAEARLREAIAVVEDLRAQAVGAEADRAAFLISRAAPYRELLGLLADSGRSWEALSVAESARGRVLLDVLAGGHATIGGALDERERAEERRLEGRLLVASSDLRAQPRLDPQQAARLETRRAEARAALEDFRTRAYAAHPELEVYRGESRALTAEDARRQLADGRTAFLEYALGGRRAYLFVLGASRLGAPELAVHRLELDGAQLEALAADFRRRCAARDLDLAGPSARLYRALVAPAREALGRARRVVIVPDGRLWELPFQALRPERGRYLIEDLAISYAPSLSVLRDMRAPRRTVPAGAGLLALGNPALGHGAGRLTGSALMSEALTPLPEAETQVREIARLYAAASTKLRLGGEARESAVKAEAGRYRVLHFATHGVLDDRSPLYSELVLAAPKEGDGDDGLLEAREIMDLDLHADLAVLSACDTGRGEARAGEGLIGMAWAFFVAGCPATVASQWKVEAASAGALMVAFHRALRAGRTPAEALRQAALAQLARPGRGHPFHWAAFVAMGDAEREPGGP